MIRKTLFSALGVLCLVSYAMAQSLDDIVKAQVLPGWRAADGTHMAALHLELADGWKTYWRSPGDVGIPPRFDWRGSRNVAGVEIMWPTPRITVDHGMYTVGYSNQLVLPMQLKIGRASCRERV